MDPEKATTTDPSESVGSAKLFTLDEANRALVLVRRIVTDIARLYRELLELRARHHDLAGAAGNDEQLREVSAQIAQSIEVLNRLHDELTDIGCVLKDWAGGLVDFPAVYDGRQVWLCWRLGEPEVAYWHELEAGFSGRQPVDPALT